MEIVLNSLEFTKTATIGELFVDGVKVSDTLEDTFRQLPSTCPNTSQGKSCECPEKVYGKTCIPAGRYRVVYRYSPKFGNYYAVLENVPHFLGILIHAGATVDHTEGCILVGDRIPGKEQLKNQFSKNTLVKKLVREEIHKGGEVWITVNRK